MLIYDDQLDISVLIMAMRAHNKINIIKNNLWLFANMFKLTAPPCGMIICYPINMINEPLKLRQILFVLNPLPVVECVNCAEDWHSFLSAIIACLLILEHRPHGHQRNYNTKEPQLISFPV